MKIALFSYEFFPSIGGVSRHLTSFCKAFQESDHQLYVFNQGYNGKDIFGILEKKNYSLKNIILSFKNRLFLYYFISIVWRIFKDKRVFLSQRLKICIYFMLKPQYLVRTIKNLKKIYPYFKKYNFDLILGGTCGSNILNLVYVVSLLFNKKVIAWAHGNEFLTHSAFSVKTCFLKTLKKIIISNHQIKYLIKEIHNLEENQLVLIPYGLTIKDYKLDITKKEIRQNFNIQKEEFIILSVGRHVPRKNFDLVIQAIKEIKEANPEYKIKYYLIGTGPESSKLKELAKILKVEKYVFFLGAIEESVRNKFYKIADVFVMPSIKKKESVEGFGLVFLEANLFKVPVIGASSGGIKEAIINGKSGFLIEPNDIHGLIEKINFLYNNQEIKTEMGEYGQKRVITNFNWEELIQKYFKLFNEINENNLI